MEAPKARRFPSASFTSPRAKKMLRPAVTSRPSAMRLSQPSTPPAPPAAPPALACTTVSRADSVIDFRKMVVLQQCCGSETIYFGSGSGF
ncbi:MAG: hypothetical protein AN484_27585 [Aphanizomenon flos-aquae WA102]|uniref:Uncharacterized protein n=1 Tax=Aphanizomenon flos-aquae WA102 TaxID=1710896 RepID=A0A1B7W6X6_APHFL|nr:MAG: hypothetical protein AN484_27585 [Aphanizomenon flos-aquae WA102]